MKKAITTKMTSMILVGMILLSSCASTTMIQSSPSGAKVYLNEEPVGNTPYYHTDTRIVGSTTAVRLEKQGFESFNSEFSRDEEADVGAIVGGCLIWVPFLWAMKYKPTHTYELTPLKDKRESTIDAGEQVETKSKVDRLREFKQLLDENIITQEEFNTEKKKILEE